MWSLGLNPLRRVLALSSNLLKLKTPGDKVSERSHGNLESVLDQGSYMAVGL